MTKSYALKDLSGTGLLWVLNEMVLHPAGLQLGLEKDDAGDVVGFQVTDDFDVFPPEVSEQKSAEFQAFVEAHKADEGLKEEDPVAALQRKLDAALAENERLKNRPAPSKPFEFAQTAPQVIDIRDVRNVLLERPRFAKPGFGAASYKDESNANVAGEA